MHSKKLGDSKLDRYTNISTYDAYHVVEKFKEIFLIGWKCFKPKKQGLLGNWDAQSYG